MRVTVFLLTVLAAVVRPHNIESKAEGPPQIYDTAATETWRAERERDLRSGTGWLTVAGLTFLKPGPNSIGSDPQCDVVLPDAAPSRIGTIVREGNGAWFEPAAGVDITWNSKPLTARVVLTPRDRLIVRTLTLQVHASGDRLGVRVRDVNSRLRQEFSGLKWYPVSREWNVAARFEPYESPRTITVPNVSGDFERLTVPGEVVFLHEGREVRLQAAQAGRRLWIIFSDALGGKETYRIRFLYADAPDATGRVTLDFNRAYNPPCAYNPFTTCPLPPAQNRLRIAIGAGERLPDGKW